MLYYWQENDFDVCNFNKLYNMQLKLLPAWQSMLISSAPQSPPSLYSATMCYAPSHPAQNFR